MIIHAGEVVEKERIEKVRIETFVVGKNVLAGEKVQWIVDGGKFKASFLLDEEGEGEEGLLISEVSFVCSCPLLFSFADVYDCLLMDFAWDVWNCRRLYRASNTRTMLFCWRSSSGIWLRRRRRRS